MGKKIKRSIKKKYASVGINSFEQKKANEELIVVHKVRRDADGKVIQDSYEDKEKKSQAFSGKEDKEAGGYLKDSLGEEKDREKGENIKPSTDNSKKTEDIGESIKEEAKEEEEFFDEEDDYFELPKKPENSERVRDITGRPSQKQSDTGAFKEERKEEKNPDISFEKNDQIKDYGYKEESFEDYSLTEEVNESDLNAAAIETGSEGQRADTSLNDLEDDFDFDFNLDDNNEVSEDNKEALEKSRLEATGAFHGDKDVVVMKRTPLVFAGFVLAAFLALVAGIAMALWDMDRSVSDLIKLSKGSYEEEYKTLALKKLRSGGDSTKVILINDAGSVKKLEDLPDSVSDNEIAEGEEESREEEKSPAGMEIGAVENIVGALDSDVENFADIEEASPSVSANALGEGESMEWGQLPQTLNSDYVDPNAGYPLPFSQVDDSYFADALFIGDSRLQGFGMYSGLQSTYYCATGFQLYKYETTKVVQTPEGKVPIFDALTFDAYTKIYIKVGINEL
ncbi:MAG: hypothetical protein K5931_04600, partial [Lachnospiraceae bacterium]|nr:hypothetical protein [Lachnospiraceae bacterium]